MSASAEGGAKPGPRPDRPAMRSFVHESLPTRVLFGMGSLDQLPAEIDRLGCQWALVLASSSARAEAVVRRLGSRGAGVYDKAVMHVPVETAREARDEARRLNADAIVAVGYEAKRGQYGAPPARNANFTWEQHMMPHLASPNVGGFVFANG